MMTHKMMRVIGIVGAMMVITAVFTISINRVRASEAATPAQTTAAQVGNGFTYQGSLEDGGTPVNGNCDFQFSLFDANAGGTQAGVTIPKSNVAVNDGVFAVELDFGDQFTGDARYLEIAVSCPAGIGNFVLLNGRVSLTAAPYALSLRPGAIIQGSVTTTSTLQVINSSSSGEAYGVYGQTDSNNFNTAGVFGHATAATGTANGIYGKANSNEGTGVFGFAGATSGTTSGVYGQVWSDEGVGVFGLGIITGTYGYANVISGVSYGVYGDTRSPDGYGVYSNGNAHVEGDLTWKPVTGRKTISAAAFRPNADTVVFTNWGNELLADSYSAYLADVQLPHNAVVTKMIFYWKDNDPTFHTSVALNRTDLTGNETSVAIAHSSGDANVPSSSFEDVILTPIIDNSAYSYYLWLIMPSSNFSVYGVTIEYTINQPY